MKDRKIRKGWSKWSYATAIISATFLLHASVSVMAGTQFVSAPNPSLPASTVSDANSVAPSVSPDGRFVLFVSSANDLVSGDNNLLRAGLFLRDRASNTTTLISVNLSGTGDGNSNSYSGTVSTNGRYVVFASDASDLVPGDTNGVTDIFLRDTLLGTTTLVSVATNGGPGNGASVSPVMTPDGRYVAFISLATNLVAGDNNGIADVFVRDMVAGATTLVSVGATGPATPGTPEMDTPVITPDGRYVAFFSIAANLPSAGISNTNGEIYVRDLTNNITYWASTNALALAGIGTVPSTHPGISDDGRYVAFKTGSTNGPNVKGINQGASCIFQFDSVLDTTTLITSNAFPAAAYCEDIYGPQMTPDGRYIAYSAQTVVSNAIVSADIAYSSVHLWDRLGSPDTIVSQYLFGGLLPHMTFADTPVITPDGQYVAFVSTDDTLVTNPVVPGSHIYLRNLLAGTTQLVDVDANGSGLVDVAQAVPAVSANGQFVAFSAPDGDLVSGDNNRAYDVFVRDTINGTNQLISVHDSLVGETGNGFSYFSGTSLNPTGQYVVFASSANNLVPNDFNGCQDVFVHNLQTGSNTLVSVGLDGNSAQGGDSGTPVMSANGRYVAFISAATNLVATNLTNSAYNLYLRDLLAGTTVLANVDSNGLLLTSGDCSAPAISQDGRYVTFLCKLSVTSPTNIIYWRDTVGGRTMAVAAASTSVPPAIRADGRYVGYGTPTGFFVWDSQSGANIYSNTATVAPTFSESLSPTGTKALLYWRNSNRGGALAVVDYLANSNIISPTGGYASNAMPAAEWSTDGRFVTLVEGTPSFGPIVIAFLANVYLYDTQLKTVQLVSSNYLGSASATGGSDWAAISGDGRFVTFRSFATDIVPGLTNVPNIFLFDRYTGSNTLLTAESFPGDWISLASQPAINGDGSAVAYQSWRGGLVPGELALSFTQDIFGDGLSPWGTTDTVGDGIPDEWRAYYFGGTGTTTNSQSCATCDPDGDGMSNLQEFLAGTDPTNPSSVLSLQVTSVTSGGSITLSWPAVPGKIYSVQYTESLGAPDWLNAPGDVTLVGLQGSYPVSPAQPAGFYRVVCDN
jgi:Tol biopolymer transport system component